jgi:hypothetical protein
LHSLPICCTTTAHSTLTAPEQPTSLQKPQRSTLLLLHCSIALPPHLLHHNSPLHSDCTTVAHPPLCHSLDEQCGSTWPEPHGSPKKRRRTPHAVVAQP